ncbi:MAG: YigZ family protein [Rhodothermus sp.]|nr:YigZ family protein [Rhodothermus sp.]
MNSNAEDTYRVVAGTARAELRIKGSRFIAEVFPVETEAEATKAIVAVRRREHAATHHCTAYRLGPEGEVFRYHDDGEPSGTAGLPILRQIEARQLTNTLVVVTRYFGGIKLGRGGLIRSYGEVAARALDQAPVAERVVTVRFRLRFAYGDTAPVMRLIERTGARIGATRYDTETELLVEVPRSSASAFAKAFVEALAGRGQCTPQEALPRMT